MCIFVSLLVAADRWRAKALRALDLLLDAYEEIAMAAGLERRQARERAVDAAAVLQGTLAIASLTQDTRPFRRYIDELPDRLVGP